MNLPRAKRKHLRAPLNTVILYEDNGFVFKANGLNISEGGILLEQLPHVPDVKLLPLMISLNQYPDLQRPATNDIKKWITGKTPPEQLFPRKIIRARSKIVRSFQDISPVDKIFVQKIGCQFVNLPQEAKDIIAEYVSNFAKNIVFLLSFFESSGNSQGNSELIRSIAFILGYNIEEKFSILRQKVLHDYQSLESL